MNVSEHANQENGEIKKIELNHSKISNNHDKTNKHNNSNIQLEMTNKTIKKQNNL